MFALFVCTLISSCSSNYIRFFRDAAFNPPQVEELKNLTGERIDLYSIEVGEGAKEVIFFVSGSGCASLSYFMRWYFSGMKGAWKIYAVQKAGVSQSSAGVSCTRAFHDQYDFETLKARNDAALQFVAQRHGKVSLVGVSEGGQIAGELAQDNPSVKALVLIGTGGLPFRKAGLILDSKNHTDTFRNAFEAVEADPVSMTKKTLGWPRRYWSFLLDRDPLPVYLSLKLPILAVFGELDQSVPLESMLFMKNAFEQANKTNLEVRVVPDASHTLVANGTDQKPLIMAVVSEFLRNRH